MEQDDQIIQRIRDNVGEEDFLEFCENELQKIEFSTTKKNLILPLLNILEDYPSTDFGMPGPMVHFLEKFFRNGYEDALANSVSKKPTKHTVWMMNRLINGTSNEEQSRYRSILENLLSNTNVKADIKRDILFFLND